MKDNSDYEREKTQTCSTTELDKLQSQRFLQDCPKLIHILKVVDDTAEGDWKQQLQQIIQYEINERIMLIPHHLEKCHWFKILIEFQDNRHIQRAEPNDSVADSKLVLDQIQHELNKLYPGVILSSRILKKHAQLIIPNSLKSIEESQTSKSEYQNAIPSELQGNRIDADRRHSLARQSCTEQQIKEDKTFRDQLPNTTVNDSVSLPSSRTQSELYASLTEQLRDELHKHEINDEEELEKEMVRTIQEIQILIQQGRQFLSKLEELQQFLHKIKTLERLKTNDNLEQLKRKLTSTLLEHDISSEQELKEEIRKKEQEIETLEKRGKHKTATKRRNSLSKLEELQELNSKIKVLQTFNPIQSTEISNNVEVSDHLYQIEITPERRKEDMITIERVRTLYDDFILMPSCSEKSLLNLLFFIALKLIDETILSENDIIIPDDLEMKIANEIPCLKERLKIEELESTQIENLIRTISRNIKRQDWKSVFITIENILKLIRPLNIPELFRLFQKVDDTADLIRGENIILFLGKTGAGKSTTIHFLGGSKLKEIQVTGLNHIHHVQIKNPNLQKITTTPFARSETRFITPVRVYFKDIGGYSNESIVLCDSPGFEDTNGPEVDIANGIGIVKAIRECKTVKPVIVISYKSIGDRLSGIKDLARTLVQLIPNLEDYIKTFSYIFTKFPPNEKDTICALLTNVEEIDKSDMAISNLLKDMIKKMGQGARALDPIHDDPFELLHEFVQSKTITSPDNAFQPFLTLKSTSILQEQVRKHQLSIISATKRSDYLFIRYKLDQLKYLNAILNQEYIQEIYKNSIQYLVKHLSQEYQEGIFRFNSCERILRKDVLQHYQTCIDHAKLTDELRENHLGQEVIHSSVLIENLNQRIEAMSIVVSEREINDQLVKVNLDKIKLISYSFSDIDQEVYQNICQNLTKKFEQVIQSFKTSVLSNMFDQSANEITKFHEALSLLQDHFDYETMREKYTQMKEYFLQYLNDLVESLDKNDIDNLNNCVCILENISNLQLHISKETIDKIDENFLSKILNYFEEIIQKITTELKNENTFHTLEKFFIKLDLLRNIPIIELRTAQSYYNLLENIFGYLRHIKRNIEQLLREEEKLNYDILRTSLFSLKSAQWIDKYCNREYSNLMKNIEQQFLEYIKRMKISLMKVNLDLDNHSKIKPVYKSILELNQMKQFEEDFPDIKQDLIDINSCFESMIMNAFLLINDLCNIEKFELNQVENACHYLDICKTIPIAWKCDCLEESIRYYSRMLEEKMHHCLEKIEIYENISNLSIYLQEIVEIKIKYPRIFSHFINQNIFEYFQRELSNYLHKLSREMERFCITRQTIHLQNKLVLVKALRSLDRFLEAKKFADIYTKYQSMFFIKVKEISEKVASAIQTYDYQQVAYDMLTLKLSGDIGEYFFQENKQSLNRSLIKLIEETKIEGIMLENNLEIHQIKSIVENLKRIEKAKQFLGEYLNTPDELSKDVKQITLMIEHKLNRFFDEIKALMYMNNLDEVEQKIELISLIHILLGKFSTKQISDEIEFLKEYRIRFVSDELIRKYSDMNINEYIFHPPRDIFEKLAQVSNRNPIYNEALNKLRENIINKFRQELQLAVSVSPPNPNNIHIKQFESSVQLLPETIKNVLEVELKHCKDDINSKC